MTQTLSAAVCLIFASVIGAGCSPDKHAMSLKQAEDFIHTDFEKYVCDTRIVLGNVAFVDRDPKWNVAGRQHILTWPLYEIAQRMGYVEVKNVRDIGGSFTGWNDFFALTQGGIKKTAEVLQTEKGLGVGKIEKLEKGEALCLDLVKWRNVKVISSELLSTATDKYRVLLATFSSEADPEWREALNALYSGDGFGERRIRWLIKFDPILEQWKSVTADYGNLEGDFSTDNVGKQVKDLQATK